MKSHIGTVALFVFLLFAADEVRSALVRAANSHFSAAQTGSMVVSVAFAYALPFAGAGAVLAWRLKPARAKGIAVAALLGACAIATYGINGFHPTLAHSHGPLWLDVLGWANWYMPVVGALSGAGGFNAVGALT